LFLPILIVRYPNRVFVAWAALSETGYVSLPTLYYVGGEPPLLYIYSVLPLPLLYSAIESLSLYVLMRQISSWDRACEACGGVLGTAILLGQLQ
jgi:hypothetical protein